MADSLAIVQTDMDTTTGTQTITGSLGGATPAAAILIIDYTTADATFTGPAGQVVSVTDGTTHFCTFWRATDGVAPTATNHARSGMVTNGTQTAGSGNEQFISMLDPATAFRDIEATGPSLISNGLSFTIDSTDGIAYKATAVFLYGDISAEVQCESTPSSLNGTKDFDFTTITGELDSCMIFAAQGGVTTRTGSNNVLWTGGWACNGTSITQSSYTMSIRQGVSPSQAMHYMSDAYVAGFMDATAGTYNNAYEATTFTTDGSGKARLELTSRVAGANNDLGFLALKLGNGEMESVTDDTDTTGLPHTQSVAGSVGSVLWGFILGSRLEAKNTLEVTTSSLSGCFSVYNGSEDDVFAFSYTDSASTTVSKSWRNTQGYAVPTTGGAFTAGDAHRAGVSPNGENVDITYAVTDTSTPRFFSMLIAGMPDAVEVANEALGNAETTAFVIGQVLVTNEALSLTEASREVQGNFHVENEALGLVDSLSTMTITENMNSVFKGEVTQGRGFRGLIQQSPGFKGEIQ